MAASDSDRLVHDPMGGMPRLLDFYKCYRAYVRGKVESLQPGMAVYFH